MENAKFDIIRKTHCFQSISNVQDSLSSIYYKYPNINQERNKQNTKIIRLEKQKSKNKTYYSLCNNFIYTTIPLLVGKLYRYI